jgi:hypothetical protein
MASTTGVYYVVGTEELIQNLKLPPAEKTADMPEGLVEVVVLGELRIDLSTLVFPTYPK